MHLQASRERAGLKSMLGSMQKGPKVDPRVRKKKASTMNIIFLQ